MALTTKTIPNLTTTTSATSTDFLVVETGAGTRKITVANLGASISPFPTQTGKSGQVLSSNGTSALWTPLNGFKNLIINGDKSINQRGTTGTTNGTYYQDRWKGNGSGLMQIIENLNVKLSGTYTISFTGTATCTISDSSDNASYSTLVSSVASGTNVTLTAGKYVKVSFSSTDFSFVQLEYGNVATAYEQRSYALEYHLCKRYYQGGISSVGPVEMPCTDTSYNSITNQYWFNPEMRATPSGMTQSGNGTVAFYSSSNRNYVASATSASLGTPMSVTVSGNASAEL